MTAREYHVLFTVRTNLVVPDEQDLHEAIAQTQKRITTQLKAEDGLRVDVVNLVFITKTEV